MIAKKDLTHGAYYAGECRNADLARWDVTKEAFVYWRTKFGDSFIDVIYHPDDDEHFDVFVPHQRIEIQDIAEDDEIPLGAA